MTNAISETGQNQPRRSVAHTRVGAPYRLGGRDRWGSLGLSGCCHHIRTQRFLSRRGRLRPVLWIGYPAMQHHHKGEAKTLGNNFELGERQIALVQLSIRDALFDELIHKRFDFLRWRFLSSVVWARYNGNFPRAPEECRPHAIS